eukprot:TRINITY_DN33774_c0_g1_i1.p1 TRINITY_DN33774_c0_g1~~TRINITY_DN33774_c0_g1_i1.p1  ORF type:complete len:473 (-),score=102.07 TRINITY_DN33774_c0_g1_i1:57-1475(-)
MGNGVAALIPKAMQQEEWLAKNRGPTLRRLFGAYTNADVWAVCRKFRHIDDGNGYVSYEELQDIVHMEVENMLFVFDVFAQQNELIDSRELMTMVSLFSSCRVEEKARFLMNVFDVSKTGSCTGAEICTIVDFCFSVIQKCTGVVTRQKETKNVLIKELPQLLTGPYAEAVKAKGEMAYHTERVISQNEMDSLIPSILQAYEATPFSGPAPSDSVAPPPPDWGAAPASDGRAPDPVKKRAPIIRGGETMASATKKLTESELAHLSWMARMDGDENNQPAVASRVLDVTKAPDLEPAARWLVIHGSDFHGVARDLASFRHSFVKGVSTSIGITGGCVEVVNIGRGIAGGVVVQFVLHPTGRKADDRDGETLVEALIDQLGNPCSAIRKGPFSAHAESGEIVNEDPMKPPDTPAGEEREPQNLKEALVHLAAAKARIAELEAAHQAALEELKRRDAVIARLDPEQFKDEAGKVN